MGEEHDPRVEPTVILPEVQVDMDFVGLREDEAGMFVQRFDPVFSVRRRIVLAFSLFVAA